MFVGNKKISFLIGENTKGFGKIEKEGRYR
jgi:hypothetical protein